MRDRSNIVAYETWLEMLRSRGACLAIGATGHLLLSDAEQQETRETLRTRMLPELLAAAAGGTVMLVSGSAPGADLTVVETASHWFRRMEMRCMVVAMEAVPLDYMVQDWADKLESEGQVVSAQRRMACESRLAQAFSAADLRVRMYRDEDAALAPSLRWREQQYRKLGAALARRMDILIAVLRPDSQIEPGGTAEIVAWRKRPERIPASLSMAGPGDAPTLRRTLLLLDPRPDDQRIAAPGRETLAPSEADVLREAEEARAAGNDLLCHDILHRAMLAGLRTPHLDYLRLQALANAGSPEQALEQYRELELDKEQLDEDWLALLGRLEKDLALRGSDGDDRPHLLRAAAAYLDAFRLFGGYYSGINAATMLCLAGDVDRARQLARETAAMLHDPPPDDPLERFYQCATHAEIALLQNDTGGCRDWLACASDALPDDFSRRSRTRLQLRDICERLALDSAPLDAMPLPPVVVIAADDLVPEAQTEAAWQASLRSALREVLPNGALVYLRLTGPLDLLLAEAALHHGVRLYPILGDAPETVFSEWRTRHGAARADRLREVLRQSERASAQRGFLEHEDDWAQDQLWGMALGLSMMTARRRGCLWQAVSLQQEGGRLRAVERARTDCLRSQAFSAGAPLPDRRPAPDGRRMVGILFADFAGYRRLRDEDLPLFWNTIFGEIAAILDRHGEGVLSRQTWGDAVHVITRDAVSAAHIAVAIQQLVGGQRRRGAEALQELEMRLALHYAPAYLGTDPVRRQPLYYGSQLAFAARIEPVAPPGMIYGSEPFAARLAVDAAARFATDYAGDIELAKRFGRSRLYALRRSD